MNKAKWILVAGMILLFAAPLFAQEANYVQSVKAKVMSGSSFKSQVLGEVSKGYKFETAGRAGSWIKVKFNSKDGYVSSLLLSSHPPMEKTGLIKGEGADINQGVRRRASSSTSAAAARGLTADDRIRSSREEEVDYKALEKVEAYSVNPDEISKFMAGGR